MALALALVNVVGSLLALWAFGSIYAAEAGLDTVGMLPIPADADIKTLLSGWSVPLFASLALIGLASGVGVLAKRLWGLHLYVFGTAFSLGLECAWAYRESDWVALAWMLIPVACLYYMLQPRVRQVLK